MKNPFPKVYTPLLKSEMRLHTVNKTKLSNEQNCKHSKAKKCIINIKKLALKYYFFSSSFSSHKYFVIKAYCFIFKYS